MIGLIHSILVIIMLIGTNRCCVFLRKKKKYTRARVYKGYLFIADIVGLILRKI